MLACGDERMMHLAYVTAEGLASQCETAAVLLTSKCTQESHGNHVSVAVLNRTGKLERTEAEALCCRLRSLAAELEARFAPPGGAN